MAAKLKTPAKTRMDITMDGDDIVAAPVWDGEGAGAEGDAEPFADAEEVPLAHDTPLILASFESVKSAH